MNSGWDPDLGRDDDAGDERRPEREPERGLDAADTLRANSTAAISAVGASTPPTARSGWAASSCALPAARNAPKIVGFQEAGVVLRESCRPRSRPARGRRAEPRPRLRQTTSAAAALALQSGESQTRWREEGQREGGAPAEGRDHEPRDDTSPGRAAARAARPRRRS